MTGLGSLLSKKYRGGSGLWLLALLLVLMAVPLWQHRSVNHPLAASERIDACALLAPLPPDLAGLRPRSGVDNCELLDEDGAAVLSVGFSSNRSIANGSNGGTAQFFATWVKEVRASGAVEMQERAGPWRAGESYRLGDSRQLLVEDGGLLIVLSSPRLEEARLLAYANSLAPRLRKQ